MGFINLTETALVASAANLSLTTAASAQADPGLMARGVGQVLYCCLLWRGHKLPVAVLVIGLLGGLAGLLTLAVYETQLLALVQLLSLAVLGTAVGVVLMRQMPATADGAR